MSGWIITFDGARPDNWEIAKKNSVWATRNQHRISEGDDIFFWETKGGGLIAHAVAAEDARPVSEPEGVPWPDHAEKAYGSRFDLVRISEAPQAVTRSWSDLQDLAEFGEPTISSVIRLKHESGIERLRALVLWEAATGISPDVVAEVDGERDAITSVDDARKFVERSVAERQGQQRFRRELLEAYGNRCCISQCDAKPALEAAHIVPYKGDHTNTLTNGLLLRADLHTLFDLFELTVNASSNRIQLSDALKNSQYREFDQVKIHRPSKRTAAPAPEALRFHNEGFAQRHVTT